MDKQYPEINKTFSRFIVSSMVILTVLVLTVAGTSVQRLLIENLKGEQNVRVQEAVLSLRQYVQVRSNQLLDQRSIPLLTQTVIQPESLLPSADDLLSELYLQQQLYQQKLLDFSGGVLYQRYSGGLADYSSRSWFTLLSDNPDQTASVIIKEAKGTHLELVVPLVYNGLTEGFLLTHIPWDRVISESNLLDSLQEIPLLLGEPENDGFVVNPDNISSASWLPLEQSLLNYPVYFQIDESKVNALISRHLVVLLVVMLIVAGVMTMFALHWGQRLFVLPIESLRQHIKLLEDGTLKKLKTPRNSSSEMAGLIRQFNRMAARVLDREEQLKLKNHQLIENQQQLLQSEKMASVGTMAAGVAHEINNPVAFVLSNTHTLKEYIEELSELITAIDQQNWQQVVELDQKYNAPELIQDSQDILSESEEGLVRVKDIVSGLKRFAHADSDTKEPVNVKDCIGFTIKLIWNEIKYVAELKQDLIDDVYVEANDGQLSQVFANLLINASHAIEQQGVIEIVMTKVDGFVQILISDTGKGMSAEKIQRIFEPFYTDKEVGVGTGLGLSISLGIVQGLAGDIQVDSEPGVGTRFVVRLPMIKVAQPH
ncbi:sensor histidine kinase [Bacterioplanoides sp. SCSIO 12839]|uniref:sensor histidine kinase n=1 Tax=Bacterioplanoides sp. SCSIO 12839 TaxID=2829569 RepID=UPI002102B836|nr:ATP-binding protein [Bacterioplanoides sp. SCSIO 12839]UTW49975.1 hypothetical protein KFF03_08875 [Bacterioplanoides sp. SCSIO 12839]